MGEKTGITWANHTHNEWIGCTEINELCDNCYAKEQNRVFKWAANGDWGRGVLRHLTSEHNRGNLTRWDRKARQAGEMRRVFCFSLSDLLDTEVPHEWTKDFFAKTKTTTNLWYLFLTKRPSLAERWQDHYSKEFSWWGTSIGMPGYENWWRQICGAPARLHWLSIEPLLRPFSLKSFTEPKKPDWIVVGGESKRGGTPRPLDIEWIEEMRSECTGMSIPLFVKQVGQNAFYHGQPYKTAHLHGADPAEWPESIQVQEFPTEKPEAK